MLKEAKFTMAKTFDQAIADDSAYNLYSARNAKFDELKALIQKIDELKDKGTNTRSTRDKFYRLKSNTDELITLLKNENRDLCTAFFKLNSKMTSDANYRADQTAVRDWIEKLEDALSELTEKMETESVIPVVDPAISLAPSQAPAASDINSVLLQVSKQISDSQKQMAKDADDRQKQMAKDADDRMLTSSGPETYPGTQEQWLYFPRYSVVVPWYVGIISNEIICFNPHMRCIISLLQL